MAGEGLSKRRHGGARNPSLDGRDVENHSISAARLKELELENSRLRKAVSDLTLDKLILQEASRGNF